MAIFAVFRVADPSKMGAVIDRVFPGNYMQVAPGEWLISGAGTAKEISDKLEVTPGSETGSAIQHGELLWSRANRNLGLGEIESGDRWWLDHPLSPTLAKILLQKVFRRCLRLR